MGVNYLTTYDTWEPILQVVKGSLAIATPKFGGDLGLRGLDKPMHSWAIDPGQVVFMAEIVYE